MAPKVYFAAQPGTDFLTYSRNMIEGQVDDHIQVVDPVYELTDERAIGLLIELRFEDSDVLRGIDESDLSRWESEGGASI